MSYKEISYSWQTLEGTEWATMVGIPFCGTANESNREKIRCGPGARAVPFAVTGPHPKHSYANAGPWSAVSRRLIYAST
jgi:hypothetical protein